MSEICNLCGRSVKPGDGLFVNRIPDLNSVEERKDIGRGYPEGDWICRGCDNKNCQEFENGTN